MATEARTKIAWPDSRAMHLQRNGRVGTSQSRTWRRQMEQRNAATARRPGPDRILSGHMSLTSSGEADQS
jgi:hypothetical protein